MAYSGAQITRLGLSATPRGLYGSFAGKSAPAGRIMGALAGKGGLAGPGGLAGKRGGIGG